MRLIIYITLAFSLSAITGHAIAGGVATPESEIKQHKKHALVLRMVNNIITTQHYTKPVALDDELSSKIMADYIASLDYNRSYFTKSDIDEFMQYEDAIDDSVQQADLSHAITIFNRYRERVNERTNYAIDLLAYDFNFDRDEQYQFDRSKEAWLTMDQLDDIWRKRVKNDILNLHLADKSDDVLSTLEDRYKHIQVSTARLNSDDLFQIFINSYTTAIDPHTSYLSPRVSENFDISMRLSLEGIGAVLNSKDEYVQIVKIIHGGPADLSGQIKAKDKIVGVGQGANGKIEDVIGWRLDDVVDKIRGPKGTILRLEILTARSGYHTPGSIITLKRDKIKLEEQAASSSLIEIEDKKIGVIDIPTFYIDFAAQARKEKDYKSTTRDVRKLIQELEQQDISGLIIDLRGNGGGALSEALSLTGLFIEKGPVVQTKDSFGNIEINVDPDSGISYPGPLAVLVDHSCASASEIFAGAIQDYKRGVIIGEPTFGKGTVQNVVDLNRFIRSPGHDYGRLKITIAQFYRVNGASNQYRGVTPDIIFPTLEYSIVKGEHDLDNALPWNAIEPARYSVTSAPIKNVGSAKEKHIQRIQNEPLFQLLLSEHEFNYNNSQRKQASLLKTQRKIDKELLLKAQRDLQNKIRLAQHLEPLPDDHATATEEVLEDEPELIDVLLNESAHILYDLIVPVASNEQAAVMDEL